MTRAGDLISNGTAERDMLALLLAAVADVNRATAALREAAALHSEALAKLVAHSRVMADPHTGTAGHFRAGLGFEYDAATGTHNVTGTAAFEEALTRLRWVGPAPRAAGTETETPKSEEV